MKLASVHSSMDAKDKAILRMLQEDAKASIERIAGAVGLSHTPVWKRIDRLEKSGVILGTHCRLNREALGLEVTAFTSVKLSRHDEKALLEFERAVQHVPEIVDCYSMTGSFDYLIRVVVDSMAGYETFIKKKLVHLPYVGDMHSSLALREIKQAPGLPI